MIRCFRRFERQFVYRINTATPLSMRYSVQTNGNRYGIFTANCCVNGCRHLSGLNFPNPLAYFCFHCENACFIFTVRIVFCFVIYTREVFDRFYPSRFYYTKDSLERKERTTAFSFKKSFIAARFVTAGRGWRGSEGPGKSSRLPASVKSLRRREKVAIVRHLPIRQIENEVRRQLSRKASSATWFPGIRCQL